MEYLIKAENETLDEFLLRIGCLKEEGICNMTWVEQAYVLNSYGEEHPTTYSESYWRKRFKAILAEQEDSDLITEEPDTKLTAKENLQNFLNKIEKQRIKVRDERQSFNRSIRKDARFEAVIDLFKEKLERMKPFDVVPAKTSSDSAVYAMQSDVHYGMTFDNYFGRFNSDIAASRVMHYASEIVRIGKLNNASVCYVSLMGDMVSGTIHSTIRIENKENAIEQVIGVSELVSDFLHFLSGHFEKVYVNSVSGNHSRIDPKSDDSQRSEKLDALIPWYCKARLENCKNVVFIENAYDDTIGSFSINGYSFVCVHGDMDSDLKTSAQRIERTTGKTIDYFLAGHMHVPETTISSIGYIRNGAVCGSGDEYTVKKRLFGRPSQVCFIVTNNGVESIYPVAL